MSRSRSPSPPPDRPAHPQAAFDALLEGEAGDPIRRALWLEALDREIRPCLPAALATHARLANIDNGKLVYLVDGPVWHARLRLAAAELLDIARSFGLEVSEVVVKTTTQPLTPRTTPDTAATSPVKPLSAAAREALQTALDARGDDSSTDGPPRGDDA